MRYLVLMLMLAGIGLCGQLSSTQVISGGFGFASSGYTGLHWYTTTGYTNLPLKTPGVLSRVRFVVRANASGVTDFCKIKILRTNGVNLELRGEIDVTQSLNACRVDKLGSSTATGAVPYDSSKTYGAVSPPTMVNTAADAIEEVGSPINILSGDFIAISIGDKFYLYITDNTSHGYAGYDTYWAAGDDITNASGVVTASFVYSEGGDSTAYQNKQMVCDAFVTTSESIAYDRKAVYTFTPDASPTNGDVYSIRAMDDEGYDHTISFTVGATETVKEVVEQLKAEADSHKAAPTLPWDAVTATENDSVLVLTCSRNVMFLSSSTGGTLAKSSDLSTGSIVDIPAFYSDSYYISFLGVTVPDGESLLLQEEIVVTASSSRITNNNIFVDFTQSAGSDFIRFRDRDLTDLGTQLITCQANDKYDIHLIVRRDSIKQKCNFVNYVNGQGEAGTRNDIVHRSLTSQVWKDGYNGLEADNATPSAIRRILLTQATGTGASIERIVVSRQPVVTIGDSFSSKEFDYFGITTTTLSGAAKAFRDDSVFTNQRYVICGGSPGFPLLYDYEQTTYRRFSGYKNGLADYPYALYVFINGCSINDISRSATHPTTNAEAISLGKALAHACGSLAARVKGNQSEALLSEMCYLNDGYEIDSSTAHKPYTDLAVTTFNSQIKEEAARLSVPFAKTARVVLANEATYYNADNLHLTDDGYAYLASQLVSAWEGNQIPASSGGSSSTPMGSGTPMGGR